MRRRLAQAAGLAGIAVLLGSGGARATIPTTDAAQLTQHAQTAATTVALVPVKTKRQDAGQGIRCAVTTGRRASVADPSVQPQPGAGSRMIQPYAPDLSATPPPGATGAALGGQTMFTQTGDVAAGLEASRATLSAAGSGFTASSRQVGTAPTVMAAIDMNSASRVQNNLAWNAMLGSANLWVTALNAMALAGVGDASRAATGMRATAAATATTSLPLCPAGTVGSGTLADPCRPAAGFCSAAAVGGPSCTASGAVDAGGAVVFVVLPTDSVPLAGSPALTLDAVAALLSALGSTPR